MFTIEIDHIDTDRTGYTWPDHPNAEPITSATPGAKRFYLHDDDGELYYSGWLIEGEVTPPTSYAMEHVLGIVPESIDVWAAVYDWGMAYAGTTTIRDGRRQVVIG
jgi:hypothetical protein